MQLLSSSIELKNLRFHAGHGISRLEQCVGCTFRVNVRIGFNIKSSALEADRLEGTLNYAELFKVIQREFMPTTQLIEHAAWRVAKSLLKEFDSINTVDIEVEKLNPPISADCESASIRLKIERS